MVGWRWYNPAPQVCVPVRGLRTTKLSVANLREAARPQRTRRGTLFASRSRSMLTHWPFSLLAGQCLHSHLDPRLRGHERRRRRKACSPTPLHSASIGDGQAGRAGLSGMGRGGCSISTLRGDKRRKRRRRCPRHLLPGPPSVVVPWWAEPIVAEDKHETPAVNAWDGGRGGNERRWTRNGPPAAPSPLHNRHSFQTRPHPDNIGQTPPPIPAKPLISHPNLSHPPG